MKTHLILILSILLCVSALMRDNAPAQAITPKKVVNLLADPKLEDFTHHFNAKRSVNMNRDEVFSIDDAGQLRVSGEGWGYLRTNKSYRDYHLVLEYKWGEHTWGSRADRARDCGLLVHSYGEDGAYGDTWMNSIEAQLIEGGSGDILVLAYTPKGGEKPPTSLTSPVAEDKYGKIFWSPEGEARVVGKGRINWRDRDPDWKDVKGFRGPKEIENPVGEWNRMEVICKGGTIEIYLNGEHINGGYDAHPTEGYICLQSEMAECFIRRYELHPLGTYKEKWDPPAAYTDTGYSHTGETIPPRKFPLSAEESQAAWHLDGDYEVQLVAAEPITCDPVDVVWDEKGRMFVAEMGDYPLPTEAGPQLSRIRLLSDTDGDGRMDKAVTWADHLDHVQGLLPMNGGLLATTRTAILFLKDTDGDDKADEIKSLFVSNEPRHNQLQVSCPRWGLDNAVYLNNGLDGKEIYPADQPEKKINFTKMNLRYDPRSSDLTTVTGVGQFGGTQDDWGRRFFCTNRSPAIFAVLPLEVLKGNKFAGLTSGQEDIQEPGAKVWPLNLSHTTSIAHAGTHTAACGLGIYRGNLAPDLAGNLFVCDPTSQLVTRNRLNPNGASFTADRVGEKRDFFVSSDEWSRPVNVRNGPDGALYVCDMYRRYIDHARFFPEEYSKTNYMRAGFDQGRIWRIVPKGAAPMKKVEALPEDSAALVALLEHDNAWQRIHAQRLLVDRQQKSVSPALEKILETSKSAAGRAHAFWTLHGLGLLQPSHLERALADSEPGLVENAIQLASRETLPESNLGPAFEKLLTHKSNRVRALAAALWFSGDRAAGQVDAFSAMIANSPGDTWLRRAVMSTSETTPAPVLANLLSNDSFTGSSAAGKSEVLIDLARAAGARANADDLAAVCQLVKGEPTWWHAAVVTGLGEGLRRSSTKTKSVAALIANPPAPVAGHVEGLKAVLDSAEAIATDRSKAAAARLAALPLVQQQGFEKMQPVVEKLIDQSESPEIQAAVVQALSRFNRSQVAEYFFARWDDLAPTPRREALGLIAGNTTSGMLLMKKMKAGEIPKSLMPPMQRWSYGRSKNEELKALADELFGQADADRAAVITKYQAALAKHKGDATRGEAVFAKATCITCHSIGGAGIQVGPDITDVKMKPADALLTDILDPNRAVEERWAAYTVETTDGRTLAGLISAETADNLELKLPGGLTETVPRAQVKKTSTTGLSLMPVGLEAAITEQDMADLIAYLKKR